MSPSHRSRSACRRLRPIGRGAAQGAPGERRDRLWPSLIARGGKQRIFFRYFACNSLKSLDSQPEMEGKGRIFRRLRSILRLPGRASDAFWNSSVANKQPLPGPPGKPEAGKWRRKSLKSLNPRRETVWPRQLLAHEMW